MDVEVLGMLYSTHTLDLVWALESRCPASCQTPATSIDSIRPNNNHYEETKNCEKRSNSHHIVLYCLGLHTQNQRLREVDLEPTH